MDHHEHHMMSTTTSDPHAGHHHMVNTTTLDPHAGHHHMMNTTADPHAGHIMTTGSMDHSGHGSMSHQMMMVMHTGFKEIIVFPGWETNSVGSLIGSGIALMLIAIAYEALKLFRDKITDSKLKKRKRQKIDIQELGNVKKSNVQNVPGQTQTTYFESLLSVEHLVQTILHVMQFSISYFIMLAFMTYNYWLCLCILIGIGIGFFFFGVRRSKIDLNEDCH